MVQSMYLSVENFRKNSDSDSDSYSENENEIMRQGKN